MPELLFGTIFGNLCFMCYVYSLIQKVISQRNLLIKSFLFLITDFVYTFNYWNVAIVIKMVKRNGESVSNVDNTYTVHSSLG